MCNCRQCESGPEDFEMECDVCDGTGEIETWCEEEENDFIDIECPECLGSGWA